MPPHLLGFFSLTLQQIEHFLPSHRNIINNHFAHSIGIEFFPKQAATTIHP
jgi:hypothetical protein